MAGCHGWKEIHPVRLQARLLVHEDAADPQGNPLGRHPGQDYLRPRHGYPVRDDGQAGPGVPQTRQKEETRKARQERAPGPDWPGRQDGTGRHQAGLGQNQTRISSTPSTGSSPWP
jgi:hypothetical protein